MYFDFKITSPQNKDCTVLCEDASKDYVVHANMH